MIKNSDRLLALLKGSLEAGILLLKKNSSVVAVGYNTSAGNETMFLTISA